MQEARNGSGGPALTSSQGLLDLAASHIYTLNTRGTRLPRSTLVLNYAYALLFRRECAINRPISISRRPRYDSSYLSPSPSFRIVRDKVVVPSPRVLGKSRGTLFTRLHRAEAINARGEMIRRHAISRLLAPRT